MPYFAKPLVLRLEYSSSLKNCGSRVITSFVNGKNIVFTPVNLNGEHWVGLIFEKPTKENNIKVSYLDSEQKQIKANFKELIVKYLKSEGFDSKVKNIVLEKQVTGNCGPELIENLIWCLTGERVSQDQAVPLHSHLLEENLLSISVSGADAIAADYMV